MVVGVNTFICDGCITEASRLVLDKEIADKDDGWGTEVVMRIEALARASEGPRPPLGWAIVEDHSGKWYAWRMPRYQIVIAKTEWPKGSEGTHIPYRVTANMGTIVEMAGLCSLSEAREAVRRITSAVEPVGGVTPSKPEDAYAKAAADPDFMAEMDQITRDFDCTVGDGLTPEGTERDDEGRPYQCGAFVSGDSRWECRLESDHRGEHEWRLREPDESERERRYREALEEWWEGKRPVGWSEDKHRANPYVNLTSLRERSLVDALIGFTDTPSTGEPE